MARQLLDVFRETGRIELFLATERLSGESTQDYCERLQHQFGEGCFSEALFFLTHMSFAAKTARSHWNELMHHRERLSAQTGRSISMHAAVVDYFTSIHPIYDLPVSLEATTLARCARPTLMDELTGLFNRRFFNSELEREMERSRRLDRPMSLFMVDIDHFKNFNDTYGHASGDRVLASVARVLREQARITDQPARFGGEEFTVILPHTDKANAIIVAERFRTSVEQMQCLNASGTPLCGITVSIGVSQYPEDATRPASMVNVADRALYRAKHQGRNRVCANSKEDREAQRLAVSLDGEALERSSEHPPLSLQTVNISSKGACCKTSGALQPGTVLDLILRDPRHDFTLPVGARTVWSNSRNGGTNYSGLVFDNGSATPKSALENYFDILAGHS